MQAKYFHFWKVKNEDCINSFGQHLKKLRKKQNFSQQYLADISDVDKKTIHRIEHGTINPSLDVLCSIAFGLNITLSELLDFKYQTRKH